ncbi:MAG: HAD family phosphatase [Candidatus Helarchaeota archaeon]|nr:HAD family phosphatase [Candidatus Helarchaeota archaeon]
MIKNIIFDLGNVLLSFRPQELLSKVTDDQTRIKGFMSKVTGSKTWLKLDRGTISINEARDLFLKEYPEEEDLLIYFFDNWKELFAPIQNSIDILKKLKLSGYKTYALSNFVKEAFEYVSSLFDFFKTFDGMVISYRENVIKPEKEIYEILLLRYKLTPEECLFIDDIEGFCLGAEKLGIKTILFDSKLNLKSELEKFGIKF